MKESVYFFKKSKGYYMPKIPDFSELTKKLDLHGIMDSLKSAIGSGTTKLPEGDELTAKFAELAAMAQKLATAHSEQSQAIAEMYTKINNLAKEVQVLTAAAAMCKAMHTASEELPKDEEKKD